jgi:Flp pilus assembly protein TadD
VAFDNGDLDTAKVAYNNALEKGRNSVFVTAEDYGHLCRVQVEQGDTNGALETLKKGKHLLQANPEAQFVGAVARSIVYAKTGNKAEADKAMDEAAQLNQEGARADERFMLDFAGACMATGREEQADAIIRDVARNAHDSDSLLAKAKRIYDQAGRGDTGEQLLKDATSMVRNLNNEAVILAHKGNYGPAVEKLREACWEAPHNPRILMNTVWVMLKHIEQSGMDDELMEQARGFLLDAEKQAPGHGRLATLRAQMKDVEARYGIRRR